MDPVAYDGIEDQTWTTPRLGMHAGITWIRGLTRSVKIAASSYCPVVSPCCYYYVWRAATARMAKPDSPGRLVELVVAPIPFGPRFFR